MQPIPTSTERREQILEVLNIRRFETVPNLAVEFGVSRHTIMRDIQVISCYAPIYTKPGRGGGVCIAKGYYLSRKYLSDTQEKAISDIIDGFPADKDILQTILLSFAKPKR